MEVYLSLAAKAIEQGVPKIPCRRSCFKSLKGVFIHWKGIEGLFYVYIHICLVAVELKQPASPLNNGSEILDIGDIYSSDMSLNYPFLFLSYSRVPKLNIR